MTCSGRGTEWGTEVATERDAQNQRLRSSKFEGGASRLWGRDQRLRSSGLKGGAIRVWGRGRRLRTASGTPSRNGFFLVMKSCVRGSLSTMKDGEM